METNKLTIPALHGIISTPFTLLAPDIIESILDGREPDGFSQNMLVGATPVDWREQLEG